MKIKIAKSAGFCFGVNRAIETVNELLDKGNNVCTFGEIIHNEEVINELNDKGVNVVRSFFDIKRDSVLVIRSHGVEKEVIDEIENRKIKYVDATCPYVKKIHNIVKRESTSKKFLLISGDPDHAEVIGIKSYFEGKVYIFRDENELNDIISKNLDFFKSEEGIMLSQTTFSIKKWKACVEVIQKLFTNIKVYDTICSITSLRQSEAEKLSKDSDLMIVIGGKKSSNTKKLFDVCSSHTQTLQIEKAEELVGLDFRNLRKVGITAGASTPYTTVQKVKRYLENVKLRKLGDRGMKKKKILNSKEEEKISGGSTESKEVPSCKVVTNVAPTVEYGGPRPERRLMKYGGPKPSNIRHLIKDEISSELKELLPNDFSDK